MSATVESAPTLRQWLQEIEALYSQLESWAQEHAWATLRDRKSLREPPFGDYEADVLLIHAPQGRVLVEPIARFLTDAEGLLDVNMYPSFDARYSLVLRDQEWGFEDRDARPRRKRRACTKRSFTQVVRETLEPR